MINGELVSIIMPSYNTGQYISESIKSVIDQTYDNWELIIVDDCSTDNTDEVVKSFDDFRIKYIKNNKNLGAALSRNIALRESKGKWIAFLDSDDLWSRDKLEKQIEFMLKNNFQFSYTKYEEIDENGAPLGVQITGPERITKRKMYNYCYPGCLTVMYDAEKIGLIQIKDIKKNNDYSMWLEICEKSECWLLDDYLGRYRKRKGSISRQSIITLIGWHYKLWHEAKDKNIFISIWYTGRNLLYGFIKKMKYVKHVDEIGK